MGPIKILTLVLALHLTVPSPSLPQSLSSSITLPPTLFADAAPATQEQQQRRRRQEERKRKRDQREQEQKERYRQEQYRHEQRQRYVDNENDANNSEKDNPFGNTSTSSTISLSGLFVTQKPRDALEGIRSAFSNAIRGTFYGIAALFASPIGGYKFGAGGVVAGLIAGVILGVAMPLAGFVVGGYQILRGLVATPEAIVDGFLHCKIYDETKRTWMEYRLDEDIKEIEVEMKGEKMKQQSNNGNGSGGNRRQSSGASSSRKVKSTEYYDLLNIQTDATSSDIRSAYRKMARVVHPDKNPDDPEAGQKFRELSAAYQTLSDPAKRTRYDSSGVGVDPEQPEGAGGSVMLDPIVFFAILFGSEQVEPYIGELGMATTFDALLKLGSAGSPKSFESWEDVKTAFGWSEAGLKRRKRETEIAIHLRSRVADYVDGFLALDAFKDSCWEEAVSIAKGGSYGASFLLAIGPALVAEADAFLGYRSSVLGSWRGPVSNAKRNFLFFRRKFAVTKAVLRTASESLKALYYSAEFIPIDEEGRRKQRIEKNKRGKSERVAFNDKELLKDNLSNTIPTILDMAWTINYVDISNTLYGACGKLFHDADISSWEERLRRAEAVHILGSQFYLVGLEVTGGNTTLAGDADDIKAQANAAFMESLKKGRESNDAQHSEM